MTRGSSILFRLSKRSSVRIGSLPTANLRERFFAMLRWFVGNWVSYARNSGFVILPWSASSLPFAIAVPGEDSRLDEKIDIVTGPLNAKGKRCYHFW